ncbi:MAG: exodeoxyribonuclease VII small subunit [bacterium]
MTSQKNVEEMSFEEALQELETIVQRLETGDAALEDSIKLYERGAALKTHCEKTLKQAREKIEKIVLNENGDPEAAPASFD